MALRPSGPLGLTALIAVRHIEVPISYGEPWSSTMSRGQVSENRQRFATALPHLFDLGGAGLAKLPMRRQLTLNLGGETVTLGRDYLDDRTVHGDPTLQHGYAMTVHVAQGLTVDHCFLLVGPGLNRELGYTALSRGRETNQLYVARDVETPRVEYAPADPHRIEPIARLAAQLATTSETTLAIDTGDPATANGLLAAVERDHRQAVAQRRTVEASRGRWLPHRRRELEQLRHTETQLVRRVEILRRQQTEQNHGARPFLEDRDDHTQYREMARLIAERRLQRELGQERGRGLER